MSQIVHPRPALPAPGGAALTRAAIVLGVGLAALAVPFLFSSTWRLEDPSLALVAWLGLPFAVLAALAALPARPMRPLVLAVSAFDAVLVTFAVQHLMERDLSGTVEPVAAYGPPALALLVLAAWGADAHLQLRADGALGARRSSVPLLVALGAAVALTLGAARLAPVEDLASAETFVVLLASIAVEALPFVLLGALVSAALEVFVPNGWFERVARLPLRLQMPAAVMSGFCFPVCECGSVPVARRLISRGVHPAAGVAFMLSSPIVNPIVLFSTYVAYQGRGGWAVVAGRAVLGVMAAAVAALVLGRRGGIALQARAPGHEHDHAGHDHAGHDHGHAGSKLRHLSDHLVADLTFMGKFVVLGAALAALLQTAVPQSTFAGVLASPVVGGLVLMAAAFVLSLCSEADAFVAVSFIQFPLGPQLAFLVFGPIMDLKLGLLYSATFGWRFVGRLIFVLVPFVLATSLIAGEVIR
ncbi:MAG TPA: permease [Solirubrobacteraceae bacterium]|nr:permease [Solirubrobacteraceae bacterium]